MKIFKNAGKTALLIAENAPTLLTVVIGAYVVLKNQQYQYEVSKLLEWTITLLCLIASSMLIERFIRLKRIEKNVIETNNFLKLKEGKASLDEIIITRKNLEPLEDRLKYAKDVKISGASLFRLATEYMNLFENKAKEGCKLKFLLLNQNCEAVKLIATYVVYEINDIPTYTNNIKSTINSLKQLKQSYPKNIEIKVVDFLPAYSLIITDSEKESGIVRLELYTQKIPTRDRPQMVFTKDREPKWYKFFVNQFDLMWNNSNSKTI